MKDLLPVLVVVFISSATVFIAVYSVLNRVLTAEEKRRNAEINLSNKKVSLTIRLQAYERLVMFIERISPDFMIMHLKQQIQTNSDLHLLMLQTIRSEYEYNLSQQLYVSVDVWDKIKETREQVVNFINDAAKQVNPNGASIELTKKIFDLLVEEGQSPIGSVINDLKAEARKIY